MIALSLTIRSAESALWLELLRERFRRFQTVPFEGEDSIVLIPRVGAILVTDSGSVIAFHAVAQDQHTAAFIRDALQFELARAVPETNSGDRLRLEWEYPSVIPVALRA